MIVRGALPILARTSVATLVRTKANQRTGLVIGLDDTAGAS